MKTLIVIFLLAIYSNLFSQNPGWNDIDTTDILNLNGDGKLERIALFANHYGIHVLKVLYTGDDKHVTYYRLKTTGELDDDIDSTGTYLDDYGDFPNIVGDENVLYAVYRKNDTIKVHKSTNGGNNWSSIPQRTFLSGDVNCNGVDAVYNSVKGLHVVWSEEVTEGKVSHYESYYNRLTEFGWDGSNVPITDHAIIDSAGGFPTITTSNVSGTYRAHITLNTGIAVKVSDNFGVSYSSDLDYINNWTTPIEIDSSKTEKLLVTEDDTIHCFYYRKTTGFPKLNYSKKHVTDTSWGVPSNIDISASVVYNTHKVAGTSTSGDILHAFWWGVNYPAGFNHKKKHSSDTSWSTRTSVFGGTSFQDAAVTSASNDLYFLLTVGPGGDPPRTNYKFRQYDDIPLPPQNLTVDKSAGNHPELEWDENYEPDLDKYYIYRLDSYGGGWQYLAQTSNEEYEDTTLTYCTASPPAECENERDFYYRITAVDLQSHESEPSDSVEVSLVGGAPDKKSANNNHSTPVEYSLRQNYPNPFNPTTNINFSLKEESYVTLKVYDVLGREVDILVNGNLPAGVHSVEFNGESFESGLYFYEINTGTFRDTKKFILIK